MSTLPAAVLTVIAPRPPIMGDAILEDRHLRPAAPKTRPCVLLASAHWGLLGGNLKYLGCTDTAYTGKARIAGQSLGHLPDDCRTKQVGTHQAVCVRMQNN